MLYGPVTENLFNSGVIPTISMGVSYIPDGDNVANGEITFGATDTAKYYVLVTLPAFHAI